MNNLSSLTRKLGIVIKLLRTEASYTQLEVAQKSGITWRYLSDIEHGKRSVSIDVYARIASVFNLKLSQLISKAEAFEIP